MGHTAKQKNILFNSIYYLLCDYLCYKISIWIPYSPFTIRHMTSFGYFNPFSKTLLPFQLIMIGTTTVEVKEVNQGPRNPGSRRVSRGRRAENGQPGQNGEQGAPGPAGNRGRAGPQGPVVQYDPGRRGPAALKKVSRVRNEFPEAWIWADTDSRYTLCDILYLYRYRPLPYGQCRQRYRHSFQYMLHTCVHPDAFWLRSSLTLVKIAWASSTNMGLLNFPPAGGYISKFDRTPKSYLLVKCLQCCFSFTFVLTQRVP